MEHQDRIVEDGTGGDAYECPFQKKDCNDYCGVYDKAHERCSLITVAVTNMSIATSLKAMMDREKQLAKFDGNDV
jgi:hypothetical protein